MGGLCILFAVAALVALPIFYCCRRCGRCGGRMPRKQGYSRRDENIALIVLAISFILVLYVSVRCSRMRQAGGWAHVSGRFALVQPS